MTSRYEAGKAEANAKLQAQQIAATDAQAAITQAAEAKLNRLQLQVCPAQPVLSFVHTYHSQGSPLLGCRLMLRDWMFKSVCKMHKYTKDTLADSSRGQTQSVQRQSEGATSRAGYLHPSNSLLAQHQCSQIRARLQRSIFT